MSDKAEINVMKGLAVITLTGIALVFVNPEIGAMIAIAGGIAMAFWFVFTL